MIYVVTHKKYKKIKNSFYRYLLLGESEIFEGSTLVEPFIENKFLDNRNFAELNGLFWVWKNTSDPVKGIVHYRRFLINSIFSIPLIPLKLFLSFSIISEKKTKILLKQFDILLPPSIGLDESLYTNYKDNHHEKDLLSVRKVICEIYPDYLDSFDYIIFTNNTEYRYFTNIMITRGSIFDQYSKWLFDILMNLMPSIKTEIYDKSQSRVYGFLAERLLNVWIYHNNLKIMELPMVNIESNYVDFIKLFIRSIIKKISKMISLENS